MLQLKYNIAVMLVFGTLFTACQRQSSDDVLENDPLAATSARPEDQFGKGFGKAFRADRNSEPAIVADGDVIPVSHTAEPVQID